MSAFAQSRLVDGCLVTCEAVFLQPGDGWAEGVTITSPDGTTVTPDDRRDGVAVTVYAPEPVPPRAAAAGSKPRRSTAYTRGATHVFARPDVNSDGLVTRGWLESAEGEAWLAARVRDVLGPKPSKDDLWPKSANPATHLLPGIHASPETGPFVAVVDRATPRVGLVDLPLLSRESGLGHPPTRLDAAALRPIRSHEPTPWVRAAEAQTEPAAEGGSTLDRFEGCLLGLAIGDAFGLTRRHLSAAQIRQRFPGAAFEDFGAIPAGPHLISAHTQLALFTAEAMIRADRRANERGIGGGVFGVTYHAYLRWMAAQGKPVADEFFAPERMDGWLRLVPEMGEPRHPSRTTIDALASGTMGTVERPINKSSGCSAVPRVVPAGLLLFGEPTFLYDLGRQLAALTHGGQEAQQSAGFLVALVRQLAAGSSVARAVNYLLDGGIRFQQSGVALHWALGAVHHAAAGRRPPEVLAQFGASYLAHGALGFGVYCAAAATSFAEGVANAVNHGGDSDATGAVAGAMLGLVHGKRGIPAAWLGALELRGVIEEMARDLFAYFGGVDAPWTRNDRERYPGW